MTIGDNIRQYRTWAGLTQDALAQKSGVSLASIQRYEQNVCLPKGKTLQKVADALNLTCDELRAQLELAQANKQYPEYTNFLSSIGINFEEMYRDKYGNLPSKIKISVLDKKSGQNDILLADVEKLAVYRENLSQMARQIALMVFEPLNGNDRFVPCDDEDNTYIEPEVSPNYDAERLLRAIKAIIDTAKIDE